MKTCTDCPAYRLPNDKPHGFCPLGHQQVRQGYIVMPKDDCPKPKDHAELMTAIREMEDDNQN